MSDVITVSNWINDAIFVSLVNTTLQMAVLIPLIALCIWIFRIKSARDVNEEYKVDTPGKNRKSRSTRKGRSRFPTSTWSSHTTCI